MLLLSTYQVERVFPPGPLLPGAGSALRAGTEEAVPPRQRAAAAPEGVLQQIASTSARVEWDDTFHMLLLPLLVRFVANMQ